jgi:hypothetical protein
MPEPLAKPMMLTFLPSMSQNLVINFGLVSVVKILDEASCQLALRLKI